MSVAISWEKACCDILVGFPKSNQIFIGLQIEPMLMTEYTFYMEGNLYGTYVNRCNCNIRGTV